MLCRFSDAVKLIALTGLMWLWEAGVFVVVGRSLGLLDQASGAFFSMTTATLSTLIPSSPGYIGTFHYFSMQGLMAFGTGADAAAAFAIIVHLLLWLPPTLVGLISLSLIWK